MECDNNDILQEVHKDIRAEILLDAQECAELMQQIGGAIDTISFLLEKDALEDAEGRPKLLNADQRVNLYIILKLLSMTLAKTGDILKEHLEQNKLLN